MQKDKNFLAHLPNQPGVYQMLGAGREVLYVGKALDLKKRVSSYFSGKAEEPKTQALMAHAQTIEVTLTRTEHEALLLECFLIKKHRPHYNVLLRDDKSYPYILITEDQPYPRILLYRGLKKGKGRYFGPYPNAAAVRETIHVIQKLFHLRSCQDSFFSRRKRPCLQYQIGLCSGSCTGLISPAEYQKNVEHAILFLKGKSQEVRQELQRQMEQASRALHFEHAAKLRDQLAYLEDIHQQQYVSSRRQSSADVVGVACQAGLACVYLLTIREGRLLGGRAYFPRLPKQASVNEISASFLGQHYLQEEGQGAALPQEIIVAETLEEKQFLEKALSEQARTAVKISKPVRGERRKWLEMAEANAKHALAGQLIQKTNIQDRLAALRQALRLKCLPARIECFDISHSQGEETVASCVVFNREGPLKSDYRRFNIRGITPGDDIAAMRQVFSRRFRRLQEEGKPLPDLVLIDGGPRQLDAAKQALAALGVQGLVLVSVSKGEGRKPGLETLHFSGQQPPLHLPPDSSALHLIQQIRDEAHRFAITGHRNRRDKKRRTSILESIPGIGAKRRRALLNHFGGLQAIETANQEQLREVSGVTAALAEEIYRYFHH